MHAVSNMKYVAYSSCSFYKLIEQMCNFFFEKQVVVIRLLINHLLSITFLL